MMAESKISPVDLHTHASSVDQAKELIEVAALKGIEYLAILKKGGGVFTAAEISHIGAMSPKLEIFYGTECYCNIGGIGGADLIGLGFDSGARSVVEWDTTLKRWNLDSLGIQLVMVKQIGLNVGSEGEQTLREEVREGTQPQRAWGLAKILALDPDNIDFSRKEVGSEQWESAEARFSSQYSGGALGAKLIWHFFLSPDKPAYISARPPDLNFRVFIDVVHRAGGVVLYSPERSFNKQIWNTLVRKKIDGVMGWHGGKLGKSGNQEVVTARALGKVKSKGLLVLGGSDFDIEKDHWELGAGVRGMFISPRRVEELRQRMGQIRQSYE